MTDFGGKLRQARERRGVSLRQIAASTKISVAALGALERNDISRLPGGIFSRAFVRSYALEVGLNPDETVREFLECFHGESPRTPVPAVPVPEEESNFENQQRMAGVLLKLVLISLPIAVLILYFTLRPHPQHAGSAEPPSTGAEPAGTPQPETGAPAPAAMPAPAPQTRPAGPRSPAAPAQAGPAQPAVNASGPAAQQAAAEPLTLELHPTGPCWVSLTVDGKKVFGRVMAPGEKDVRRVRDNAVIEIGDAGAFAFSINGRPGRSLGESGQVKTARITKDTVAEYLR